jgi:molybdopterin molybdotransferase
MLTVQEARDRILAKIQELEAEELPLESAWGHVLAEDIVARQDVPPFANSAMDGYAVRAVDVRAATPDHPVRLRVVGEIQAGYAPPAAVAFGTALRIMTGAVMPDGADAIVRVEDTRERDHQVEIQAAVPAGTSVRHSGSDLRAGDRVGSRGQLLTPGLLGVIASAGRAAVRCVRRPRVLLLTTGDELRPAGEPLGPGQITNTNRYTLRAAIEEVDAIVIDAGVARDERRAIQASLARAESADLVITSGGVSMGSYDLVRQMLEEQDTMDFWQVALRPGKPLAFGSVRGVPLIGLPGNPVSSLVAFELFARPAILKLQGREDVLRPRQRAITEESLTGPTHLEQYFRGIARHTDQGLRVRLTGDQGSHVLRSMAAANCLVILPQGAGSLPAGAEVDIIPLAPFA